MKITNTQIRVATIMSVPVLLAGLIGFTPFLKLGNDKGNYVEWMKNVDDSTSLREINMPGSHDTMALYSIGNLAGQCQSLPLYDQLELGVRFLDIRLQEDHNTLKAVHGFVDQRASFASITKTIEKYLDEYPTEFLIMSIKEEATAKNSTISFEDSLKTYLTSDIYLKGSDIPTNLGEVRGKVMLLSRYANSTIGVPAFNGWQDSTSFTLSNDIYVQDTFRITSASQKQEEIVKCFNEPGHALKINFLSAYKTNYFPPSYAPSSALDINPWINKEIANYSDRNIVLYDFVNEENITAFFELRAKYESC